MINPWLIVGALIALAGAYGWGRYDGGEVEAASWRKRELQQQSDFNAKVQKLQEEYRARERAGAERLAAVSADYQKELVNAKTAKDRAVADLRAGRLVLRDPGAAGCATGGGAAAPAGAGAGGRDGAPPGELPRAAEGVLSERASEFLIGLASEADEVARQLAACQGVVRADRAR